MTRIALMALLAFILTTENDPRLTVHTIVREDIFAGYMVKDMVRLAKGETMLEQLDKERPDQRQHVRAWQGGAVTFRAVLAYEMGDRAEGDRLYSIAQSRLDEALKLGPNDGGVWAVIATVNGLFADRLPVEKRGAAWNTAYDSYRKLGAQQMATVDKLPSHFKGELLAGLVMSAQRTGHQEEFTISLDKMIELTENTPYSRTAQTWKENPETVAHSTLLCKSCHESGRLEARKTTLHKAPQR
jgi:hypothetical protein